MNFGSILPRTRRMVVLLFVVIGVAIWIPRQKKLLNTRKAIAEMRTNLNELNGQLAQSQNRLEITRAESVSQNRERNRVTMELAKAEQDFAKTDPESRWANPPENSPEWNPDSPFVWLHKDMVPRLPVSPFTDDGTVRPEAAYVLTLDAGTQKTLNEKLKLVLTEYRALEAAKAERTEDHLPGIAGQEGEKMTVRVQPLPQEGARLKAQFEQALLDAAGEQRATLLTQTGENWIDSEFAQFGSEPKTISLIRHPGGSYNLSIKSGGSWFSTGGPANAIINQIPANLRPMFAALFESDKAGDSAQIGQ